jgi:hypothetical protein
MMNHLNIKIPYIFRLIIFWLLYFISFRILFIIYQHTKIPDNAHSETGLGFYYALPVDISVACVMVSLSFVLWIFQQFYKTRFIHRFNLFYNFFLIILTSLLSVTNIKMYGEWGELLSFDILKNLFYPSEVSSFSLWSVLLLFAFSGLISYFAIRIYRKYLTNFSHPVENKKVRWIQITIAFVLLIAGYRIDLNIASINGNRIHYSSLEINNHIATNNIWYFANSVIYSNNSNQ